MQERPLEEVLRRVIREELEPVKQELKEHGQELKEHGQELKEHGRLIAEWGRETGDLKRSFAAVSKQLTGVKADGRKLLVEIRELKSGKSPARSGGPPSPLAQAAKGRP